MSQSRYNVELYLHQQLSEVGPGHRDRSKILPFFDEKRPYEPWWIIDGGTPRHFETFSEAIDMLILKARP